MAAILIADDDPIFCELLSADLAGIGHAVTVVNDGRAAEVAVEKDAPDLLLIDIIMPEQDGLETIRNLRVAGRDVKIIAMTTGGTNFKQLDFLDMARRLGANETITKPILFSRLHDMVDTMLKGRA